MSRILTVSQELASDLACLPGPLAGVDEAGRGCLAGPVVAAAVILHPGRPVSGLADSKQLTAHRRERLEGEIRDRAWAWGLGLAWPFEIDRVNILRATLRAMCRAVRSLCVQPGSLAVDGNRALDLPRLPQRAVVKGDALVAEISAASILAKTFRDRLMLHLDRRWPGYGFAAHKGYGTREHCLAIRERGPCRQHRLTFRGVRPEPEEGQAWLPGI